MRQRGKKETGTDSKTDGREADCLGSFQKTKRQKRGKAVLITPQKTLTKGGKTKKKNSGTVAIEEI